MVLLGSFVSEAYWHEFEVLRSQLAENLTQNELLEALYVAVNWRAEKEAAVNWRVNETPVFLLISDRPDPQDANDLIYGPGTHEGNIGILKSDYERQKREYEEFVGKLAELKVEVEQKKLDSVRNKIEALEKASNGLQKQAFYELCCAIGEAAAAGLTIDLPPLAIFAAYQAVESFKEFAEKYHESIDIQAEVRGLLDLERSLEKSRELHGSGRER